MTRRKLGIFVSLFLLLGVWTHGARAADSLLADVLSRGTLRVAITPGNPPWCYVDPNGDLMGYDADIANALGKALGVQVQFVRTDTAGRVAQLQAHKADVTISTFTPTLDRMKTIAFTDPYAIDGMQVLVRADSKINTIKDIPKGARVGVGRGSTRKRRSPGTYRRQASWNSPATRILRRRSPASRWTRLRPTTA